MAALSGCRYNPALKAFHKRLAAADKKSKVVIVAVMRALIIFVIGVFIQRGCRQGTGFDCTAESLSTHGAAAFGLCRNQVVAALLSFDRRVAATALARAES